MFAKLQRDYKNALYLSLFTILANLVEGTFSTILGQRDGTLALFGFGLDSFIEVISAVGITVMILRIAREPESPLSKFEVSALKVTGISFYLLTAGLVITAILNLVTGAKPETAISGLIISLISLSVMIFLYRAKMGVGGRLNSDPIIADANCTKTCIYMSLVLLGSSLIYTLTGFGFIDTIGAVGLAWFSFTEGRESFEKASKRMYDSCCD
ncbi:MAG: cation transporter [Anaerolineaceae bacterium]